MYEGQLEALENSQFTIENMKVQSEMIKEQIGIVKTIKESSDCQKNLMKEMNSDTMFDIALDMREMKDDLEDMNNVFMDSYKVDVDEGELDAELDELDFENKDTNFNVDNLTAPNKKVLSKKEIDEKKLEDELLS